jgi:hypothetical protein
MKIFKFLDPTRRNLQKSGLDPTRGSTRPASNSVNKYINYDKTKAVRAIKKFKIDKHKQEGGQRLNHITSRLKTTGLISYEGARMHATKLWVVLKKNS